MKHLKILGIMCVLMGGMKAAHAWDAAGHKVVARIAWDHMTPKARIYSVALLEAASPDSGLQTLRPASTQGIPTSEHDRTFFLNASTWADAVRDQNFTERREKYHHSNWHYINYFWEQIGLNRTRDRFDLKPEKENAVERLQFFTAQLRDTKTDASTRSIALAWILHLVGDLHQPLHTSARVTKTEPQGDRGGNDFKLAGDPNNLHAYWDKILGIQLPRHAYESEDAYINRLAGRMISQFPPHKYSHHRSSDKMEKWAREGFQISRRNVYRGVERNQIPTKTYQRKTFELASYAIVFAGYRLADILNASF